MLYILVFGESLLNGKQQLGAVYINYDILLKMQ